MNVMPSRRSVVVLWCCVVLSGLLPATALAQQAPAPADSAPRESASRTTPVIAVVGASVSAGYKTGVKLSRAVAATSAKPLELVDRSDVTFYFGPADRGEKALKGLDEVRPDLVLAIDYLFWFGYGTRPAEQREDFLRRGLALLETVDAPVLVGDLPVFEAGGMLSPPMVPTPEALASMNGILREWAAEQEHVTLFPLAQLLESVRAGDSVTVAGKPLRLDSKAILHADGLHLSPEGMALLASLVMEQAQAQTLVGSLSREDLVLQPAQILERAAELKQQAIAEEAARRAAMEAEAAAHEDAPAPADDG